MPEPARLEYASARTGRARWGAVIDVGTVEWIKHGDIVVHPGIDRFDAGRVRFLDGTHAEFDSVILGTGYEPDIDTLLGSYRVARDANGMPAELAASGELAGVFFVGFDNKQPGGLLRTIGLQARQVADLVSRP